MVKELLKAVGAIAGVPLLVFAVMCAVVALDVWVHGNSLPPTYEALLVDLGMM